MILKTPPPHIHTIFNPVLLTVKGTVGQPEELLITELSSGKSTSAYVDFTEEYEDVEIGGLLKTLVGQLYRDNNLPLTVDDYQSFKYTLSYKTANNVYKPLLTKKEIAEGEYGNTIKPTEYTAVNSVAQIQEAQNLHQQKGKLLTGFNTLYAYQYTVAPPIGGTPANNYYPADVSILGDTGTWKYEEHVNSSPIITPIVANRVNRLRYNCNSPTITIGYKTDCKLEWSFNNGDFICHTIGNGSADFIPISTPQELIDINDTSNPDNLPYVLMNDLDFTGVEYFYRIQVDNVVLYCNGYAIKNLSYNTINDGLFRMGDSTVYDLKIIDSHYTTTVGYGTSWLGHLTNSKFINVTIENSVIGDDADMFQGLFYYAINTIIENLTINNISRVSRGEIFLLGFTIERGTDIRNVVLKNYNISLFEQASLNMIRNVGDSNISNIIAQVNISAENELALQHNHSIYFTAGSASSANGIVFIGDSFVNLLLNPDGFNRVCNDTTNFTVKDNYFIDTFDIPNFTPVLNPNGKDGGNITALQTKSQSFYEGLGYDFDGSTQADGLAVWAMGYDGYPTIIKPYKTFAAGVNTGEARSLQLVYTRYINNVVENIPNNPARYSILNAINPAHQAISIAEYNKLSTAEVDARATALIVEVESPLTGCTVVSKPNTVRNYNYNICPVLPAITINNMQSISAEYKCEQIIRTFKIESSRKWTITSSIPNWLKIDKISGDVGETEITISLDKNRDKDSMRSATITFAIPEGNSADLTINQDICTSELLLMFEIDSDSNINTANIKVDGIAYNVNSSVPRGVYVFVKAGQEIEVIYEGYDSLQNPSRSMNIDTDAGWGNSIGSSIGAYEIATLKVFAISEAGATIYITLYGGS